MLCQSLPPEGALNTASFSNPWSLMFDSHRSWWPSAWFLHLGASIFFQAIAYLFNLSLPTSTIPQQWKQASIIPMPKSLPPKHHADFRSIFITPVLTRIMEKTVVRKFYLTLSSPPSTLSYSNPFAFRPTGSPCAAVICLLSTITNMLLSNSSVTVISLDFSKPFDAVWHSTLLVKMAQLDLPVNVYN